jgi:TctA family transporter
MIVLGLLLGTVGQDLYTGQPRFTFGVRELYGGLDFVTLAVAMFGLAEIIRNLEHGQSGSLVTRHVKGLWLKRADLRRIVPPVLRGTTLGSLLGVLPGGGHVLASFTSYSLEKRVSRRPQMFGRGAIEGVAAPESANNAGATAAMVPMLTLGIPGSATTAIMLGGLMMWGLRPGPMLFEKNPQFVWGLIASQYIANIMLLLLSTLCIPLFVRAVRIPYSILMPLIVVFCVTGAYSLKNNLWDVGTMLVFGVVGYFMKKLGYSPAALVLALVLGPLAERALRQSLIISDAGLGILFLRPISGVLTVLALLAIAVPVVRTFLRK